jgi:hypothetical protein
MAITEKSLKCFFAGALPWPVGGANLNQLYKQSGFFTAWNLLPPELQLFDGVLDHRERYRQQILAIQWLSANLDQIDQESTHKMIASNRNNLYSNTITVTFIEQFDQLIKQYI